MGCLLLAAPGVEAQKNDKFNFDFPVEFLLLCFLVVVVAAYQLLYSSNVIAMLVTYIVNWLLLDKVRAAFVSCYAPLYLNVHFCSPPPKIFVHGIGCGKIALQGAVRRVEIEEVQAGLERWRGSI